MTKKSFCTITACLIASTALLSGCSLIKPHPASANLTIQSAKYLNPNLNGDPSPVVITLYQLKSPYSFKQATFDSLNTNSGKTLSTDLIDKNVIEVRPGSNLSVSQQISPNAQYLGIVAGYRNINKATWKKLIKLVNEPNKETIIHLDLESEALAVSVNHESSGLSSLGL